MLKIQERLNQLRPYVIGIRYLQGIQLVDAVLKEGWKIPQSSIIRVEPADETNNYYMFFSDDETIDIDDLLDFVQEIINHNLEREAKHKLLKEKVDELKILFRGNPLEKLKKLKFNFDEPSLVPSLGDMDTLEDDDNMDYIDEEPIPEVKKNEVNLKNEQIVVNETKVKTTKTKQDSNKFNDVELPPKGEPIIVEEFKEPQVVCKCGPDEVCPECAEEKGVY